MNTKITQIQIIPIKPNDGLVAFANLIFDNSFYFTSIGIRTRPDGRFRLTYPTRKVLSTNIPIFHPINKEIAQAIEDAIISKYETIISTEL